MNLVEFRGLEHRKAAVAERLMREIEYAVGDLICNHNGGDPAQLLELKRRHAELKRTVEGR